MSTKGLTLAKEIWKILLNQKITLILEYLPGKLNVRVEWEFWNHVGSRSFKLDPDLFQNSIVVKNSVKHINTKSCLASTESNLVDKYPTGEFVHYFKGIN